jgi:hypothetical protein
MVLDMAAFWKYPSRLAASRKTIQLALGTICPGRVPSFLFPRKTLAS